MVVVGQLSLKMIDARPLSLKYSCRGSQRRTFVANAYIRCRCRVPSSGCETRQLTGTFSVKVIGKKFRENIALWRNFCLQNVVRCGGAKIKWHGAANAMK